MCEELLANRPTSLTIERANSFLPKTVTNEEWQLKHDAGELPCNLLSLREMLDTKWPEEKPTVEEAKWILQLRDRESWRGLGDIVLDNDSQIGGMHLEEISRKVISGET